jgi:hypothetical protein
VIGAHIEIILIVTGAARALVRVQFIAPAVLRMVSYGVAPADLVSTPRFAIRRWLK